MNTALKQRIEMMRGKIEQKTPVIAVAASSQLFVTPERECNRLVELACIGDDDYILEPSAGTGAILRAIKATAPNAACDAIEMNAGLFDFLRKDFEGVNVICCDFLQYVEPVGKQYSRIIMNPPFNQGSDIKHIMHGLSFLKSGGILTAICLNGPRQKDKLKNMADYWEELPPRTFAYTDVSTVIMRITVD
ncbi:SAM-dependent methyltransferase [Serratia sp. S1B]|nr:SAM-dependent methyltransferase [Serratia sp. S1B]